MAKGKVKEYTNGELTVVWQPTKCIHSEICVKTLPQVYDPNKRPWINVINASTAELKAQIAQCPSGALTYFMNDSKAEITESTEIKVEIMKNGSVLVHGTIQLTDQDQNNATKTGTTAFCRCGNSGNKPYCDGTHVKVGFVG